MSEDVLEGIRVLEFTGHGQGPLAGAMLADLGADVIKIEHPFREDPILGVQTTGGVPQYFEWEGRTLHVGHTHFNRGKRSIVLNLKMPAGQEALRDLVSRVDVFLHNFLPRVTSELSLRYEDLRAINPRLVYVESTGFGSLGPDSEHPCLDGAGLARSGITTTFAGFESDGIPRSLAPGVADVAGATSTFMGALAALLVQQRTGKGQKVESSQLGAMVWLQSFNLAQMLLARKSFDSPDREHPENPLYNSYKCNDGPWIFLSCSQSDRYMGPVCEALGLGALPSDPRFDTAEHRSQNSKELVLALDEAFARFTRSDVERRLAESRIIFARVNEIDDLPSDVQIAPNDLIQDIPGMPGLRLPGLPFRLSLTAGSVRGGAHERGTDSVDVLRDLCEYDDVRVAEVLAETE